MIADGVNPSSILLFTFTKKAAEEMRTRLKDSIGDVANHMTICTYHSFCARLLRKFIQYVGYEPNFSIYDETERMAVLERIVKESKALEVHSRRCDMDMVAAHISACKDKLISPEEDMAIAETSFSRTCATIYSEYMQYMKKNNSLDFDDLLYFGYGLIKEYSDVRDYIYDKYTYIISDETQDSSANDLRFILRLGEKHQNVCLVLDEDQAIFKFRGGDVNYVINTLLNGKFRQYNLDQNFRSTQTIVDAAQTLIKKNRSPIKKHIFSKNKVGDHIQVLDLPNQYSESTYVAEIIKFLHDKKDYAYSDIAVLGRLQRQFRSIEDLLLSYRIPYHIISGVSFYDRTEIKDIVSYLRLAYNPVDVMAFERCVNTPSRGIGKKTIEIVENMLFKTTDNCDTMETYEDLLTTIDECIPLFRGKAKEKAQVFLRDIREIQNQIREGVRPDYIIQTVLDRTGYLEYMYDHVVGKAKDSTDKMTKNEEYQQRVGNIAELKQLAAEFQTPQEFITNVLMSSMPTKGEEEEEEKDAVNVITMHSSKGMEWRAVIIIGANQGICPHRLSLSSQDPTDVQEERRLFYVAMTRAKEELFILRHRNTVNRGVITTHMPSQFLNEIDPQYLDSMSIEDQRKDFT
jgi:DNA helicase-2/ATP-dependent DNA helicase PcrA